LIDLKRENNLAWNRKLTLELGLFQVSKFFGMKRKGSEQEEGSGKRKKKNKEKKGDEEWDEDSEKEDSDSDEMEEEGERTPVKTRAKECA
jgi:hypothetical protein